MGMPTVLSANGTSTSAIWFPDWMQAPFSVSFSMVANAAATGFVQATYDNIDIANSLATTSGLTNTAAGTATWFTVGNINANAPTTGVITSPVRAIQINLVTAGATGIATCTFIQATFPR